MNPNQLGRPPSYGFAQQGGRTMSPLPPGQMQHPPPTQHAGGPPPIQTGQAPGYGPPPGMGGVPYGYQQHPQPGMGAPPQGQYPVAGQTMNMRPQPPAEVGGETKSKSQLIVGIDFVSAAATALQP